MSLVLIASCQTGEERAVRQVPVSYPPDLRIMHGTAIVDGQPLSDGASVPSNALSVSAVMDVNRDGRFQADREPSMPCEPSADGWRCQQPTDRVIMRTENQLAREVLMSGSRYEVARCRAEACEPVMMREQGLFRATRECDGSLADLAVRVRGERTVTIPLEAIYNTVVETNWSISFERGADLFRFQVSADAGPPISAVRVWRGRRDREGEMTPVTTSEIDVTTGRERRDLELALRRDLVDDCTRDQACELWLGVARRTIVASMPSLRFESVDEDFLPLLDSLRGDP